ncbi:hypothetical protein BdWA1_002637 [Babesia duncani]|uniref:Uncharacterized protein n=1 Tax=Babesia duncani TaxID=323732 RepID=A0AAD9PJU7_9APIC|nr:hypothetical protein BdWA1_002637 [Babesia duncani]
MEQDSTQQCYRAVIRGPNTWRGDHSKPNIPNAGTPWTVTIEPKSGSIAMNQAVVELSDLCIYKDQKSYPQVLTILFFPSQETAQEAVDIITVLMEEENCIFDIFKHRKTDNILKVLLGSFCVPLEIVLKEDPFEKNDKSDSRMSCETPCSTMSMKSHGPLQDKERAASYHLRVTVYPGAYALKNQKNLYSNIQKATKRLGPNANRLSLVFFRLARRMPIIKSHTPLILFSTPSSNQKLPKSIPMTFGRSRTSLIPIKDNLKGQEYCDIKGGYAFKKGSNQQVDNYVMTEKQTLDVTQLNASCKVVRSQLIKPAHVESSSQEKLKTSIPLDPNKVVMDTFSTVAPTIDTLIDEKGRYSTGKTSIKIENGTTKSMDGNRNVSNANFDNVQTQTEAPIIDEDIVTYKLEISKLKLELENVNNAFKRMENRHDNIIKELETTYNVKCEELKRNHDIDISELQDKHQKIVNNLENEVIQMSSKLESCKTLSQRLDQKTIAFDELYREYETFKAQTAKNIEILQQSLKLEAGNRRTLINTSSLLQSKISKLKLKLRTMSNVPVTETVTKSIDDLDISFDRSSIPKPDVTEESQKSSMNRQYQILKDSYDTLQEKKTELLSLLDKKTQENTNLALQLEEQGRRTSKVSFLVEKQTKENDMLSTQLDQQIKKNKELSSLFVSLENEYAKLKGSNMDTLKTLHAKNEQLDELKIEHEKLSKCLNKITKENQKLQSEMRDNESLRINLQKSIACLEEKWSRLQCDYGTTVAELKCLKEAYSNLNQKCRISENELGDSQQMNGELVKSLNAAISRCKTLHQELTAANAELESTNALNAIMVQELKMTINQERVGHSNALEALDASRKAVYDENACLRANLNLTNEQLAVTKCRYQLERGKLEHNIQLKQGLISKLIVSVLICKAKIAKQNCTRAQGSNENVNAHKSSLDDQSLQDRNIWISRKLDEFEKLKALQIIKTRNDSIINDPILKLVDTQSNLNEDINRLLVEVKHSKATCNAHVKKRLQNLEVKIEEIKHNIDAFTETVQSFSNKPLRALNCGRQDSIESFFEVNNKIPDCKSRRVAIIHRKNRKGTRTVTKIDDIPIDICSNAFRASISKYASTISNAYYPSNEYYRENKSSLLRKRYLENTRQDIKSDTRAMTHVISF